MFYHVSFKKENYEVGQTKVFSPRVPSLRYLDDNGKDIEDSITPRVCLCPTILGCIYAINYSGTTINDVSLSRSYITIFATQDIPKKYKPVSHRKNSKPPYKGIVPDAKISGEVWSLSDIELTVINKYDFNTFYFHTDLAPLLLTQFREEYSRVMKVKL